MLHIVLPFSDQYVKGKVFSCVVRGAPELKLGHLSSVELPPRSRVACDGLTQHLLLSLEWVSTLKTLLWIQIRKKLKLPQKSWIEVKHPTFLKNVHHNAPFLGSKFYLIFCI